MEPREVPIPRDSPVLAAFTLQSFSPAVGILKGVTCSITP